MSEREREVFAEAEIKLQKQITRGYILRVDELEAENARLAKIENAARSLADAIPEQRDDEKWHRLYAALGYPWAVEQERLTEEFRAMLGQEGT